jgi:hypothetical protein
MADVQSSMSYNDLPTLAEFAATLMWVCAYLAVWAVLTFAPGDGGLGLNMFIFLFIIAPLQTIVLQAFISGQRAAAALNALRTFELGQCQCQSDSDRAALLELIARWYADPASGHLPEATQRAIGRHRFENFVRHDLRLQLLAAAGPGDRLPAEGLRRLSFYAGLSYVDMLASPEVGLAKVLTIICNMMLCHFVTTPLMYRTLAWCASLITRLRRAGWPSSAAWAVGLAIGGVLNIALCMGAFQLGSIGSILRGYVAADDGLSAEQRLVAKQQIILIAAMVSLSGVRMR